jgi:hypothetical protein
MGAWMNKATVTGALGVTLLVPYGHGQWHALRRQRQAEHAALRQVAAAQAELAALRAHPVQRLRPLARALQEVTGVVATVRREGIEATLTSAAPVRPTLAQQAVPAVPCRLTMRSAELGPILRTVQAIERGQVMETAWQIDAHGAVLEFHVFGEEGPAQS